MKLVGRAGRTRYVHERKSRRRGASTKVVPRELPRPFQGGFFIDGVRKEGPYE